MSCQRYCENYSHLKKKSEYTNIKLIAILSFSKLFVLFFLNKQSLFFSLIKRKIPISPTISGFSSTILFFF